MCGSGCVDKNFMVYRFFYDWDLKMTVVCLISHEKLAKHFSLNKNPVL